MRTTEDIVNLALSYLGQYSIDTLSDDSVEARRASALYDTCRDTLLRDYPWKFAIVEAALTEDTTLDLTEDRFGHAYKLPAKCLRILRINFGASGVYISASLVSSEQPFEVRFETASGELRLYTDAETARIRYIYQVADAGLYDSTFVEALAWRLAGQLAPALTGKADLVPLLEAKFTDSLNQAKLKNALEQYEFPSTSDLSQASHSILDSRG